MAKVEIYTQSFCPYCARALKLLSAKQVDVQEIKAPAGSTERQVAKERSGGRTSVPQIFIDGRHIGGCDDLMALEARGGLDAMLRA